MLVLTRSVGETVYIGDDISIYISEINGGQVKISIDAPSDVPILRAEAKVKVPKDKHKTSLIKEINNVNY